MHAFGLGVPFLLASILSDHPAEALRRRYDSQEIAVDESRHDLEFFTFVTRPDLDAPRWDIKLYNESALAPGFWLVEPYGIVEQTDNDKAYVAPHIYDSHGQLVWSGAAIFAGYNTFTFAVSNVGGVDMLTVQYPNGEHALLMDSRYGVHAEVFVGIRETTVNMHDFQLVDNTTRGLYLTRDRKWTSLENSRAVRYDGHCHAEFNGFEERDIATGAVTFSWTSEGRIGLDESVMYHGGSGGGCAGKAWDWVHLNSVEKLPDGDYLVSGRRTYAVYKVSHRDGSILWRLGGKSNDFDINGHFSGQHDVRCLAQNETHMLLSMLDNAEGPGPPRKTNPHSRGLILSVNTDAMTAEEVMEYPHPHKGYANGRGSFQILPNGNGFCSWKDDLLISEYSPDGTLIAEAQSPSGLKTYRGYKYPWIGRPEYPPDVHSKSAIIHGSLATVVHVSWNGATEVASWNLYRSHSNGSATELLHSAPRSGFETVLVYGDGIPYVVVEGVDREGIPLGRSRSVQTRDASDKRAPAVSEEVKWQRKNLHASALVPTWANLAKSVIDNPALTFLGGIMVCVVASMLGLRAWSFCRKRRVTWLGLNRMRSRPHPIRLTPLNGETDREKRQLLRRDHEETEDAG